MFMDIIELLIGFYWGIRTMMSIFLVKEGEIMVIERLGIFNRILSPGLHFIIPIIERPKQVNWTYIEDIDGSRTRTTFKHFRISTIENIFDPPQTEAITHDRVSIFLDTAVYYIIKDPKKALYNISDLYASMETLLLSTTRDTVSHMNLDDITENSNKIEQDIGEGLKKIENAWGLSITRICIQNIKMAPELMTATESMVKAERETKARCIREKAERETNLAQAESRQKIAMIDWETKTLQKRAETEREVEAIESFSTAQVMADKNKADSVEYASERQNHAKSNRIKMMLDAGASPDFLIQETHADSFRIFAENSNRSDMVVPVDFTRIFGNPLTLRKNV